MIDPHNSREASEAQNDTGVPPTGDDSESRIDVIPFREALDLSKRDPKRHLLLGNGFSIAIRPNIFTYNTLLERARQSGQWTDELAEVFQALETTDFETVMEAHENASVLVSIYERSNPDLARRLKQSATVLRDVLAETIAANHPARPYEISRDQYASCRRFLSNFCGCIYTLNYDLLLYWTLMQSELPPSLKSDDGFRTPQDRVEDFVVWDVQNSDSQRIFYLHGALHIYDGGSDLLKYTWSRTDVALVEQIRGSLALRKYPLIVTEGSCDQKKERIQHSGYLNRALRSFSKIGGTLFIYGHSFAENDEHLLKCVDQGKIARLFVGIYGDPNSVGNRQIIERAEIMDSRRAERGIPLELHYFDAASAHIWDDQGFDDAQSPAVTKSGHLVVGRQ